MPKCSSSFVIERTLANTAPAPQAAELESLGLAMCLVGPLVTQQSCLGTLRVGFRGAVRVRGRELQVFTTFANHVSAALHNARLFQAMGSEREELSRLRRENKQLRVEREILSKAAAWFARETIIVPSKDSDS